MILALNILLALLTLFGHAALWMALVNRAHAMAVPHWAVQVLTALGFGCLLWMPVQFYWLNMPGGWQELRQPEAWRVSAEWLFYFGICWLVAAYVSLRWAWRHAIAPAPVHLCSNHTEAIDLVERLGHRPTGGGLVRFLSFLPGNEILRLHVHEKVLHLPQLAPALDGMSIVHLSDLHFSGRIGKTYFDEVVRLTNAMQPDLVAITGDLVDKTPCIDWTSDTLGRLAARHGVYFILGNHDLRVDVDLLRRTLCDAGLVDLGGRWRQIDIHGEPVVLAGNELPWFAPAADLAESPPRTADGRPLRILLAHSPDQLAWARACQVDLVLAGHVHGGQIRFPLIGPIASPSWYGTRHAVGTGLFFSEPTLMHVSRGTSGLLPVRLNCPPELTKLVLRRQRPEEA
ncbi:MAG: metallophosphoesterase [Pirellulales bacterium]